MPVGLSVGERVRRARRAANLSRDEIARALDVSAKTVQRIEEGTRELRLSELNALVALTGFSAAFFGASSSDDEGAVLSPVPEEVKA